MIARRRIVYSRRVRPRADENTTPIRHPGARRSGSAPQSGAASPPSASTRLRGHAGDDLPRHRRSRTRQALGRRRGSCSGSNGSSSSSSSEPAGGRRRRWPRRSIGRSSPKRWAPSPATIRFWSSRATANGPRPWSSDSRRMQRAEEGSAIERIVLAHSGDLETSVALDAQASAVMMADAFAQSAVAIR